MIPGPGGPPLRIGADAARSEAHDELQKRIYHANDKPWLVRLLEHVYHWLGDALDRAAAASPGGWTGLVIIVTALVAVIIALRLGLGPLAPRARVSRALFTDTTVDAAAHRRAAEIAAAAGDYAEAVAELMRAIVRELEERGILDVRAGRTADEAATEAGRAVPALAEPLQAAARVFDDVRYGGRIATSEHVATVHLVDEDVRSARLAATGPVSTP